MTEEKKLGHRLKAAQVALEEVQKAARLFRLFPPSHPHCVKAIDTTLEKLVRFHEANGPLQVEVQFDEFLLEGATVLEAGEQPTDLPYLLYPDGVRSLGFDPGISREEIEDFVKILAAPYPDEVNEVVFTLDLVGALWQRDFAHIEYKVHDQLSFGSVQNQHDPTLVAVSNRIMDLMGDIGATPANELDVKTFLSQIEEQRQAGKLDDAASFGTQPEKVKHFLSSSIGASRKQLAAEIGDPITSDHMTRACDIVGWAAIQKDERPRAEDVARFLAGSAIHALGQGNLERATDIMDRVAGIDDGEHLVSNAVSARVGSPESVSLLAKALEKQVGKVDLEALTNIGMRVLSPLGVEAVESGCWIYPQLASRDVRGVFKKFLESRVESEPEAVSQLSLCEKRDVIEEAFWMLAAPGRESRAFSLLEEATKDEKNGVRRAVATEIFDTVTGEKERRELVRKVLESRDKAERVEALVALQSRGLNMRTFEGLVPAVQDPRFRERDADEIVVMLATLTRSGKLRAVRILEELTRPVTQSFFQRKANDMLPAIAREHLRMLTGK